MRSLRSPVRWPPMAKPFKQQRFLLPALQDLLHDVRRQEREAQDPADVALADPFRLRNLHDRAVDPFVEQLLPTPRPGKRFDQRAIRLWLGRRHDLVPIRRKDTLATTAAAKA